MYSFYRLMIVLIYLTPKDRSRAAGYTTDLYSTQFSLAFNFTVTVSILSETLSTARHLKLSWNNGSVSVRPYRFIIVRNILNCDVHGGYGFEPCRRQLQHGTLSKFFTHNCSVLSMYCCMEGGQYQLYCIVM